ncbi:MAG TPA: flagellar hook-basal body complex protein, partial [Anaerovoracaceae bacterium]|nr:flagellar hook-basal body complex protein [Anaerovoracaceae bacterium]
MLGSMYSAVSGLSAHQTKMDVIGNNIANVNTYGFKSSRVTFSDVFYQTMNGGSTPGSNIGGTNPTQLGYGSRVKSVDVIHTRAGSATTDRPLDVYINGEGYLPVKDSNGIIKYTRVGVLSFDVAGNLVDSSGNMVLGIALDPNTNMARLGSDGTVSARDLVPIKVDPKEMDQYTGIAISSNGEITAIREGDPMMVPAANTGWLTGVDVSASSLYSGNVSMSITRGDEISFLAGTYRGAGPEGPIQPAEVSSNADINGPLEIRYENGEYIIRYTKKDDSNPVEITGTYDDGKAVFQVDSTDGDAAEITVPVSLNPEDVEEAVIVPDNGVPLVIGNAVASEIKITATTYDKAGSEVKLAATWTADAEENSKIRLGDLNLAINPGRFGSLNDADLDNTVIGLIGPGSGKPTKIANLAVVNFANSDGLSQSGEGYYI